LYYRYPAMTISRTASAAPADENKVELDGDTISSTDPNDLMMDSNVINAPQNITSSIICEEASLTMSRVIDLTDLKLHSPSKIMGTPFAFGSSRFEYPFPPSSSTTSQSSLSPSYSLPGVSSSRCSHSSSVPSMPNSTAPPHHPSNTFFLSQLQLDKEPPVPPGLVKKQQRWSMGLLERRRESYDSHKSEDSLASTGSAISIDSIPQSEAGQSSPKSDDDALITDTGNAAPGAST